ncbi:MAG: protein-tyrosine phosphatase family protein [Waddliaceae bacterium]
MVKEDSREHPARYYPAVDSPVEERDGVRVEFSRNDWGDDDEYCIYRVENRRTGEKTEITRIHWKNWKDYTAEESPEKLLKLVKIVNDQQQTSGMQPFIHCRAGQRRSGTLVVARELYRLKELGELNPENFIDLVFGLVLQGREQRGEGFVQRPEQLLSLLQFGKYLVC